MSNWCFNDILHIMQETTLTPNWIPVFLSAIKWKVKQLGLDYICIHCFRNWCMIYYMNDAHLLSWKFCERERVNLVRNGNGQCKCSPIAKMHYMSLILRLQHLYASKQSAKHMVWHSNHATQLSLMTPSFWY